MAVIVEVPGWRRLELAHLVLDVNGTLAVDGSLLAGVAERIDGLRDRVELQLLSADTHGTGRQIAGALGLPLRIVGPPDEAGLKAAVVRELGAEGVAAIGNGANDAQMLAACRLGICVVGEEGAAAVTLAAADLVVPSIGSGLDLLLKPDRLAASLRR